MLEKAAHWLTGWVEMEIQGDGARFLNAAAKTGVEFWGFQRENGRLLVRGRPREYRNLRDLARRCRAHPRLRKRGGLPFFTARLQKQKGLLLGALVGVGVYVYLSGFCWGVTVTGDQRLTQAQVLQAARENGVYLGCSLYGLDAKAAGMAIRNDLEEAAWLSVNEDGCFLEVAVNEADPAPQVVNDREWSNMVASRAGTVLSIQAEWGRPEVSPGDTVQGGQLLIAGLYPVENAHPYGPEQEDPPRTLGAARGSVRALTYREFTVEVPQEVSQLVPVGSAVRERSLLLFGVRIPLGLYQEQAGNTRTWHHSTAWSPLGRELPLAWEESVVQPLQEVVFQREEDELRQAALLALRRAQREELPQGSRVVEEELTYRMENGMCVLQAKCRCEEEIGVVKKISFE